MRAVYTCTYLLIAGCVETSSLSYYNSIDKEGNLYGEKKITPYSDSLQAVAKYRKNANDKQYCVYSILFIPLNFWDITNSTSKDIKRAIKDLNEEGFDGNVMKDVLVWSSSGTIGLAFWWVCNKINGTLIEE